MVSFEFGTSEVAENAVFRELTISTTVDHFP